MSKRARTYAVTNNRSRQQVLSKLAKGKPQGGTTKRAQGNAYGPQPMDWAPLYKAPELRGMDTSIQQTAAPILDTTNTNAQIFVLNLIVPGNGSWNRQGRKVTMKSLRFYGIVDTTIGKTLSSEIQGGTVRFCIVYDKQPSGSLPTFDTIFVNTAADGTETSSFLSPLRYDNTDRFVVLRDWRKSFNAANAWATAAGTDSLSIQEPFDEYVKLPNLQTVYSGQSAPRTITDISSGALYFICRADTGGGATGLFQARINAGSFCRLRYIE